jgi:hypothetical protein
MDKDEEEPGKTLMKRPGFEENYVLENELATFNNAVPLLKEAYGEDNVKEISIDGTVHEIFNRIRTSLDPTLKF